MTNVLWLACVAGLIACGNGRDKADSGEVGAAGSGGGGGGGGGGAGGTGGTTLPTTGEVDCEGGVCVISGAVVEDLTLTADKQWLLRGGVFIGTEDISTTLTIEPGTTVYGETSTKGMLVIHRGSKIIADGSKTAPIVFTSSQAPGSRSAGDWGGLIINGRAPVNNCPAVLDGEPCEQFGEGGTGFFGGDDPGDDSGVLRYVRVEFAGILISPENELNGIAFQGVGTGTTVEYLQVHRNDDDGVEFFGGTVNWKYILVTGVSDDMLDFTDGWTGKGQFFVGQQWADAGDQGMESDNNAEDNDAQPRTMPWVSHVTLIGSPNAPTSDLGLLLREGVAGHFSNYVVAGFNEACIDVDHDATFAQATAGDLTLEHTVLDCATDFIEDEGEPSVADWFLAGAGNSTVASGLEDPFNQATPDFRPAAGSAAASGASTPADPFFSTVVFRGGVDPASDWTEGWTTSAEN